MATQFMPREVLHERDDSSYGSSNILLVEVEALVLRFAPFKVQGSTPHGCKQSLRATPPGESQQFNQFHAGKLPRVWCTRPGFTLQGWV